jgi:integrase
MGYKKNEETGCWEAWYSKRHPVTRVPVSFRRRKLKSKAEARRCERELVILVEEKLRAKLIPKWPQLVRDSLVAARDRGIMEQTIETYLLCLEAHTYSDWGERLVDTISGQEIRELIQSKVGHRSPSHQKNLLKFIRSVFHYGAEVGVLNRNPTPIMKFRVGEKLKTVLTESQVRTFLTQAKVVNSEWYPHWVTALYTGMRSGELYALTKDKVSLEKRQILCDVPPQRDVYLLQTGINKKTYQSKNTKIK